MTATGTQHQHIYFFKLIAVYYVKILTPNLKIDLNLLKISDKKCLIL